jgi:hypothetical protein
MKSLPETTFQHTVNDTDLTGVRLLALAAITMEAVRKQESYNVQSGRELN